MTANGIIDLYERRARDYDRDRSRTLREKAWLDSFLQHVQPSGVILDLGCGMGEPIARYLLEQGRHVVGIDSSPTLIDLCRTRFPQAEWLVADMRNLEIDRRFDGIVAWDSFFHLTMEDQRSMFARFAANARNGAPLLFTSGPAEGEAIGSYHGEALYHASLSPEEYRRVLTTAGFVERAHRTDDPDCGEHTVWLATYEPVGSPASHTSALRL